MREYNSSGTLTQEFLLPGLDYRGFVGYNQNIYVAAPASSGFLKLFLVSYCNPQDFSLTMVTTSMDGTTNTTLNQKYGCLEIDLTGLSLITTPTPTPTPTPTVTPSPPSILSCLTGMRVVYRYNHFESGAPLDQRCPCPGVVQSHVCLRARFIMKVNGMILEPTTPTCLEPLWGTKTWSINNSCSQQPSPNCGTQCYRENIFNENNELWNGCRDDFNYPPGQTAGPIWGALYNYNRYSEGYISEAQAQYIASQTNDFCVNFVLQCWMPPDRCCRDGCGDDANQGGEDDGQCHEDRAWIQIWIRNSDGTETLKFNGCPESSQNAFLRVNVCTGIVCE
jgi:hypothetical protein